jgi:disulfide bond formation protein DsbB
MSRTAAMDILDGISIDWFTSITWLLAIAVFLLMFFWHPRKLHWAALGSVTVFMAASAGVGVYVVSHPNDPRWSGTEALTAPLLSDTPVIGRFMEPLDAFLGSVVGGINDLRAFQNALPVAFEFFSMAGWAALTAVPLTFFAMAAGFAENRRRKAEVTRYKSIVEELQKQLDDVKRFINYPPAS